MNLPKFISWVKRARSSVGEQGRIEIKKTKEEFGDQLRKMIVGAFIAIVLVLLGFPRLSAWFEAYSDQQKNPPRTVYVRLKVVEMHTLLPLEDVYVQIVGDANANGYTDEAGYLAIPYKAEQNKNVVDLTLIKEGYEDQEENEVALPPENGDSTIVRDFQLENIQDLHDGVVNINRSLYN